MKPVGFLLVAVFFHLLAGCEKESPLSGNPVSQSIELTSSQKKVIKSDNEFGIKLLRELVTEEKGNVVISPFSVSMALGMTLNGARGDTKAAMQDALQKKGMSIQDINAAYQDLLKNVPKIDPQVTATIANSIWYRNDFTVRQGFIDTNQQFFDAQVKALDFADPGAKKTINNWVSEKTNGKIEEIIQEIRRNHVMFLINSVYFNGQWTNAFDPEKTSQQTFNRSDGSTVQVPMMHYEQTNFYYHATDSVEVAEIPYGNGSFRMTILLPKKGTVDQLIHKLTPEKWTSLVSAVDSSGRRELQMPKYDLDYKAGMNKVLSKLGMKNAFEQNRADFSGISETVGKKLYIDKVMHKTHIKVDEQGAEAAAATSVGVGITSVTPLMKVDHPFLMAIREKQTGALLFIGKISGASF